MTLKFLKIYSVFQRKTKVWVLICMEHWYIRRGCLERRVQTSRNSDGYIHRVLGSP